MSQRPRKVTQRIEIERSAPPSCVSLLPPRPSQPHYHQVCVSGTVARMRLRGGPLAYSRSGLSPFDAGPAPLPRCICVHPARPSPRCARSARRACSPAERGCAGRRQQAWASFPASRRQALGQRGPGDQHQADTEII